MQVCLGLLRQDTFSHLINGVCLSPIVINFLACLCALLNWVFLLQALFLANWKLFIHNLLINYDDWPRTDAYIRHSLMSPTKRSMWLGEEKMEEMTEFKYIESSI